jgi:hypothetical protein
MPTNLSPAAGVRAKPPGSPPHALLATALVLLLSGCAAYQWGTASLYPPHIRTVYVEIFGSEGFRRNLGEQLTEAVMKEIDLKTPYKISNSPDADSRLTGRIVSATKRVLVESPTDEPREVQFALVVEVTWIDREGTVLRQGPIYLQDATTTLTGTGVLLPEVGSSVATAQQDAIREAAVQIVGMMEAPW